jgi:hypothetical protein
MMNQGKNKKCGWDVRLDNDGSYFFHDDQIEILTDF